MKKKFIVGSALIYAMGMSTTVFAATTGTFTDVPRGDWSYQAVDYLGKAGLIDGYGDGTYQGDKTMTRKEMATVVYKAMLSEDKANIAQKALIDKLAAEYALEINKIDSIDNRLTKVEKNLPIVKISGSLTEKFKQKHQPLKTSKDWTGGQWQVRLNASADIDPNTTVHLRIADPAPTSAMFHDTKTLKFGTYDDNTLKMDRFFATTKTGAFEFTVGRQPLSLDPEDTMIDGSFFSFDGVKATVKVNNLNFDFKHGRFYKDITDTGNESTSLASKTLNGFGRASTDFASADVDAAMVSSNSGKLSWDVGWARFTNNSDTLTLSDKVLMNYYYTNAYYAFNDKLTVGAMYGKNTKAGLANSNGKFSLLTAVYGAQSLKSAGNQNLTLCYFKSDKAGVNSQFTTIDAPDWYADGWKNLDVAYNYAFSKNMTGTLEYSKVTDTTNDTWSYHQWKTTLKYKF
ncbi:hypothetical protein Ga0466249_004689 [Sporomusaceae bacterium BoRhaA]|uniref:S-layer homology domain-containing protein n=1 Tax=Pelorhabdus rhamnosifermentans TaxID=2772457 RepID=UPI001C06491E|nr:S-layer homology domain-containing protein [Pelorhabdus rhamnosifermentans]MBU2703544.1 hypothetical protein [Pelorhabdus rhamnosifermentans]